MPSSSTTPSSTKPYTMKANPSETTLVTNELAMEKEGQETPYTSGSSSRFSKLKSKFKSDPSKPKPKKAMPEYGLPFESNKANMIYMWQAMAETAAYK